MSGGSGTTYPGTGGIIVTGGASGIGAALCRHLAADEKDGQRVAARSVPVAEHAQEMQSRHLRSG